MKNDLCIFFIHKFLPLVFFLLKLRREHREEITRKAFLSFDIRSQVRLRIRDGPGPFFSTRHAYLLSHTLLSRESEDGKWA